MHSTDPTPGTPTDSPAGSPPAESAPAESAPAGAGGVRQVIGCAAALVAVPVVCFIALAFILPNRWECEQRMSVGAPPEEVHAFLDDPRHWEQWFRPGAGQDPLPVTYTFEGSERGAGAVIRWTSEVRSIGTGTITITESRAPGSPEYTGLKYTVAMEESGIEARGAIDLARIDTGTLVTITDSGTLPRFPGGLTAWLVDRGVEQRLGENLAELKRIFVRRARDGEPTEGAGSAGAVGGSATGD